MIRMILLTVILLLRTAPVLEAQQDTHRLQTGTSGNALCSLISWKAGNDNVSEFALPVSMTYTVNEKLAFYLVTAPAFTQRKQDSISSRLGGLSDVKAGGHYWLLNSNLLLTFGLNLPSGNSRLDREELQVAGIISQANYGFQVPVFGQGFDTQIGLSSALELNDWMLGFGISYLLKGGFKPYEGIDLEYDPGDEVTVTAGVNRGSLFADLIFSLYSKDYQNDQLVFQSGSSLIAQVQYGFSIQDYRFAVFLRDRVKAASSFFSDTSVPTKRLYSNKNQFDFQVIGQYALQPNVTVKGHLFLKMYSDNDFGYGGMTLFGPGAGLDYGVSSLLTLRSDLKFGFGTIQTGTGKVTLSGLMMRFGIGIAL